MGKSTACADPRRSLVGAAAEMRAYFACGSDRDCAAVEIKRMGRFE